MMKVCITVMVQLLCNYLAGISGGIIAVIVIISVLGITVTATYIIHYCYKKYRHFIKNRPLHWLDMEQRQEETEQL